MSHSPAYRRLSFFAVVTRGAPPQPDIVLHRVRALKVTERLDLGQSIRKSNSSDGYRSHSTALLIARAPRGQLIMGLP